MQHPTHFLLSTSRYRVSGFREHTPGKWLSLVAIGIDLLNQMIAKLRGGQLGQGTTPSGS